MTRDKNVRIPSKNSSNEIRRIRGDRSSKRNVEQCFTRKGEEEEKEEEKEERERERETKKDGLKFSGDG